MFVEFTCSGMKFLVSREISIEVKFPMTANLSDVKKMIKLAEQGQKVLQKDIIVKPKVASEPPKITE